MGFQMPLGSSYVLDSVTLALEFDGPPTNAINVRLFTDIGGHPGNLLSTLVTPQFPSTLGIFDAIFTTSFILQPSTPYWVVATNSDPDPNKAVAWVGNSPPVSPAGIPTYLGALTTVGASGWLSDAPAGLSIDATTVPEPSGALLLFAGILIIGFFRALFPAARRVGIRPSNSSEHP
jgi:hypothetical protein